ncbi:putative thiol-disulfide oxidoreductase DCC protein [Corchorus capsularis]|uniref:Putative thiol-disulfide oxidoreductase DCC protein n=1 Tax=Corchorus capsularis TaxID=210143 RepID=A0A1R3I4J3_COCAP|nr:putative thiol-disulfide oxidoreductase DCC protein [Corchorus capsularis]
MCCYNGGSDAATCTTYAVGSFKVDEGIGRDRCNHSPSVHLQTLTSPPIYGTGRKYQIRAIQEATADSLTSQSQSQKVKTDEDEQQSPQNWKIKMLYDGDCPLCMREVNMLRERNKQYGTIKFVDISSEDYSPQDNQGLDYTTVMGRIHAILSDGTVVTDVEAFRKLYEHVGLGWVYAITKYEPVATIADSIYGVWAKYRLQITGKNMPHWGLNSVLKFLSSIQAEIEN